MNYKEELLHVLAEAGVEGLSLKKIATHIYNCNASLFETPDFEKIYNDLAQYLSKQSKMSDGFVKRIGVRGVYALNESWSGYLQTILDFSDIDPIDESNILNSSTSTEHTHSLFDDFDF